MFKKLEKSWNSRTPVWLHNGTKENLIFQFGATGVMVVAMYAYSKYEEYKERRKY